MQFDNKIMYSIAENWMSAFLLLKNMHHYQTGPIKNIHFLKDNIFYSYYDPYIHTLDHIKEYFNEDLFNNMIDYCNNIKSTIIDAKEKENID